MSEELDTPVPSDSDYTVVLVGETTASEFDSVAEDLLSAVPDATFHVVSDIQQLATVLQEEDLPDLIVIVQSWTDQFRFSELTHLPSIGPLTHLICVYGPWCVSDGRSRVDWPCALRVAVEHFHAEIQSICSQRITQNSGRTRSPQYLPWTASRDEVFAARYHLKLADRAAILMSRRRIGIDSTDREMRQLWSDLLEQIGYQVRANSEETTCDVILWDADPIGSSLRNSDLSDRWNELNGGDPNSKLIVMTGFQTPDMVERWKSLGVSAVVSKLLPLDALIAEIEACCEQTA